MAENGTEIVTVLLTDIVNYTGKTANLTRDDFSELHDAFDSISLPIFEKYNGKVVKKIGDAFLVIFKSATEAVHCSTELQNAFASYRHESGRNLHIKVALHTGEVMHRHNDIYGDAVNTVARIESATPADGIFFSEAVFSAMNKSEIPFKHLGLKKFRGLRYPTRLFRVRGGQESRRHGGRGHGIGGLLLALIVLALLGGAAYLFISYVLPNLS